MWARGILLFIAVTLFIQATTAISIDFSLKYFGGKAEDVNYSLRGLPSFAIEDATAPQLLMWFPLLDINSSTVGISFHAWFTDDLSGTDYMAYGLYVNGILDNNTTVLADSNDQAIVYSFLDSPDDNIFIIINQVRDNAGNILELAQQTGSYVYFPHPFAAVDFENITDTDEIGAAMFMLYSMGNAIGSSLPTIILLILALMLALFMVFAIFSLKSNRG